MKASQPAGWRTGPSENAGAGLLAALTEMQLRVARRADALVRMEGSSSGLNLICWLRAEQEILEAGPLSEALHTASATKWAPP